MRMATFVQVSVLLCGFAASVVGCASSPEAPAASQQAAVSAATGEAADPTLGSTGECPTQPPPGDPSSRTCFELSGPHFPVGCEDQQALADWAHAKCEEIEGHTVASLKFGPSCGAGRFDYATFECCSGTPAPPPPAELGTCFDYDASDTCETDDSLRDWAKEKCEEVAGHSLAAVALGASCGQGMSRGARMHCCSAK